MAPTEEGLTDLEESVSKMVKKAMERAMDAMGHSLEEWVKESQTKAEKKMGLQLSHLPNGNKGEESTHSNSKETYSDVSKLLPEMPALQVFDENSERIFVQKAPTSISQGTNPIIYSPNPYWNALKTHCNMVMVYKLHENEYGKGDSKFENMNSLRFLFESMLLIDITHTIMESNGNRRGGGSFVSISPSQTPKSSEKAMRDMRSSRSVTSDVDANVNLLAIGVVYDVMKGTKPYRSEFKRMSGPHIFAELHNSLVQFSIKVAGAVGDGMYTYARAAARGKRVQSTLGVKNHAIVMPDASIDATLVFILLQCTLTLITISFSDHKMESYEEEGEIIPDCVINYYTVDGNNQPVSFSVLPLLWSEDETPANSDTQIFLCGTAVTGQKMYKKIIAWRPETSYALPMIYVLPKNKLWMQLQRPRRSFEDDVMSTLITVHCLHFLKWNLKADGSALWTHMHKAFSTYEVVPSKSHLLSHLSLIQESAKRDEDLAKYELLPTLLLETPTCEANRAKKKSKFEASSQEDYEDTDGDETFDSVCVLCDNGGVVLCCEDKCLRSFHPNINAGVDSCRESLGYSDAQLEAIQTFFCRNCQYQQHQCFVCDKLGSSDQSSVPEVFQYANADYGHFYHPNCVAELLQPCDTLKTKELQLKIHSRESFVCPAHKCNICMKGEDKAVHELQFAMCRRCPKAYHRKCLPSEITFRSDGIIDQRAWDGLLPGRILIYCMDHEILSDIGTPKRDHIIFPKVEGKMQTTSGLLSSIEKLIKSRDMGNFTPRRSLKQRFNYTGIYRGHSTYATYTGEKVFRHTNIDKSKLSTSQRTMYLPNSSKRKIFDYPNQSANKFMKVKGSSSQPAVDVELKLRMLSLYSSNVRIAEDKTFTEGKAVQTALKILNHGGNLEDAKAVCEPQFLLDLLHIVEAYRSDALTKSKDDLEAKLTAAKDRKNLLSLMSSGDHNMGSNLHLTHTNSHPPFGSIYAPTASQMANSVGLPNSGGVYRLPPQADMEVAMREIKHLNLAATFRKCIKNTKDERGVSFDLEDKVVLWERGIVMD